MQNHSFNNALKVLAVLGEQKIKLMGGLTALEELRISLDTLGSSIKFLSYEGITKHKIKGTDEIEKEGSDTLIKTSILSRKIESLISRVRQYIDSLDEIYSGISKSLRKMTHYEHWRVEGLISKAFSSSISASFIQDINDLAAEVGQSMKAIVHSELSV